MRNLLGGEGTTASIYDNGSIGISGIGGGGAGIPAGIAQLMDDVIKHYQSTECLSGLAVINGCVCAIIQATSSIVTAGGISSNSVQTSEFASAGNSTVNGLLTAAVAHVIGALDVGIFSTSNATLSTLNASKRGGSEQLVVQCIHV